LAIFGCMSQIEITPESESHIRAETVGRLGRITLTRPSALNALTRTMIRQMHAQLDQWAEDPGISAIVLQGEGRAFCAGGDIKAVWEAVGRDEHPGGFFWDEYLLDHAVHHFPKPVVSLMDGFVMGGGAGISILGSHRVATENTRFAMPETAIGFYPDAGGTFFLGRLEPAVARYLGLTGARIDGADCLHCGLATHYVAAEKLDELQAAMAEGTDLEQALTRFASHPGDSGLSRDAQNIARIFGRDDLESILEGVALDQGDFGSRCRDLLAQDSPSSMLLTLLQLEWGAGRSLAESLRMEYRLSLRRTRSNDFKEGVRARLVDRSRPPAWSPLASRDELMALFAPLDEAELPLP